MTSDSELVGELDKINDDLSSHTNLIENAVDKIEEKIKSLNIRRRQNLKAKSDEVLKVMKARDSVSF